ncbi:MAG: ATP-binding protein [Burkholderiales bacterium]
MKLGPKFLISMGLVSVVSSALVAASFLGLIPDRTEAVRAGRVALAESVAASSTAIIGSEDPRRLESVLQFIMKRNPDIVSIGVRTRDERLVVSVGRHAEDWTPIELAKVGDAQIEVPVWAGAQPWGRVEFRFRPLTATGIAGLLELPWLRLTLLCAALCFIVFYVYLGRVLRQLDPSTAIPGRVRSALDTLTEGLLVIDPRRNIVLANQALTQILGKSHEELLGRPAAGIAWLDESGKPLKAEPPWERALASAEVQRGNTLCLAAADGKVRTFTVNCSPVLAAGGRTGGVLISLEDITQIESSRVALQEARDEADAANRAKSEFLANMSHEIRTPMNAILGFTELLKRGYSKGERESTHYLNTIHTSGRHLLALINDILDLSKVESGHMEVESASCSPHEIARQALLELSVKAAEKTITLAIEMRRPVPATVQSDAARLRQIILNLLSNAIKFTQSGGVRVVLDFEALGTAGRYLIEVHDSGIGVAADRLESMFDPFTQADASITRRFGGTGLGLTISRKFARALGGDLVAASRIGEGSVFTLSFDSGPVAGVQMLETADLEAQHAAAPDAGQDRWQIPAARVLVVDDGPENRELVTLVLAEQGLWVDTAENGRIAVDKVAAGGFDLVLMDMQMPVLDGYGATRELRSRGFTLPIIALTANAMAGYEKEMQAAGCSAYITKPVDIDRLLTVVAEFLGGQKIDLAADAAITQTGTTAPIPDPEDAEETASEPMVSRLANKPRFVPIIHRFVEQLHLKLDAVEKAGQDGDCAAIAQFGHWLAGSAGSVGYDEFTESARAVEQHARQGNLAATQPELARVRALAARVVLPNLEELALPA